MMKIKIKIDPETLAMTHKIIGDECYYYFTSKSAKSMRVELWEVLSRKCLTYANNPNGKPRTIILRYHIAEVLLECIVNFLTNKSHMLGFYEQNKIELFKNDLYQKL